MRAIEYRCVVADPAWSFGDKLPGKSRGAAKNYKVMSIDDICDMEVGGANWPVDLKMCGKTFRVADNALLFLWRVSSQVEEAYRVVEAWGFTPKSEIVWNKQTVNGNPWFGMGRYVRAAHETCIVAARGKAIPLIKSKSIRSTFEAPVLGHSAKPDKFYSLVEQLCGGPRLELFARRQRSGWTCVGDEL